MLYTHTYYRLLVAALLVCAVFACDKGTRDRKERVLNAVASHAASSVTSVTNTRLIFPLEASLIEQGLVDIQDLDTTIMLDLEFSCATDNFTGMDVYGHLERCYLQKDVAVKLTNANRILRERRRGYRLIVFDGVRPKSVQNILRAIAKSNGKGIYVARPGRSLHNYGAAVDLSIVDEHGRELDMGSTDFSRASQPRYEEECVREGILREEHVSNRRLLRSVMHEAGFYSISTEWWHFNGFPPAVIRKRYHIVE